MYLQNGCDGAGIADLIPQAAFSFVFCSGLTVLSERICWTVSAVIRTPRHFSDASRWE